MAKTVPTTPAKNRAKGNEARHGTTETDVAGKKQRLEKTDNGTVNRKRKSRSHEGDPRLKKNSIKPASASITDPNVNVGQNVFSVLVSRPENVQAARLELPVVGEEQKIMEAIKENPCVVICGSTGSGKTTQIPQFLFEAGYGHPESPNPGLIAVTQPRRVAAVSMANRVATELGQYADKVSYQIRFDSTVSSRTAVKFMTDGVLIREIAKDFALLKYSIIVVDEAHERSVNTDILIGMISRIINLRQELSREDPKVKPLKLVVMSATLRVSDFLQNAHLFRGGPPPLVEAEGRQYHVTRHFTKHTRRDYLDEVYRKVAKGHRKLPAGGFLIFSTSQSEIRQLIHRLKQTFRSSQENEQLSGRVQFTARDTPLEAEDIDLGGNDMDYAADANDYDDEQDDYGVIEKDSNGEEEEEDEEFDEEEGAVASSTKIHILPLYSQLPTKEQLKVFEPVPENSRLIVVATNVAETSLTIPGIRYVFDCGRAKEKQYDVATGIQRFQVDWISKASAEQRAGRAGRTGPGHCYRLYSSAIFEGHFNEFTEPEILRTPIEGVVLQMKSMGLHNVINFPFPTPPNRTALLKAEQLLKNLGAITADGQVTETGRHLSLFPLSPRYGKMLQVGHQHGCIPYVVTLVAALSVSELFIPGNQIGGTSISEQKNGEEVYTNADRLKDTESEQRRKDFNRARREFSRYDDQADALRSMVAVFAYSRTCANGSESDKFCSKMFLRPNAVKEAQQLRRQLYELVCANNPGLFPSFKEQEVPEPSAKQIKALKQIVAAGFVDQVAIRADMAPIPPEMPRKPKRAIDMPYFTLFPSRDRATAHPGDTLVERAVFLHPTSILARLSPSELPPYLIYSHLQQAAPSVISDGDQDSSQPAAPKVRMFPLTPISAAQLFAIANKTPLIEYGKPIGKIESVSKGSDGKERRECWVVPSLIGEAGGTGWPLAAKKVCQRKDMKLGWVVEKFLS